MTRDDVAALVRKSFEGVANRFSEPSPLGDFMMIATKGADIEPHKGHEAAVVVYIPDGYAEEHIPGRIQNAVDTMRQGLNIKPPWPWEKDAKA